MTCADKLLHAGTVKDLIQCLSDTVIMKYPNQDIIKGEKAVKAFLNDTYKDQTMSIKPYLSYFIGTTSNNHMIKIKIEDNTISSLYTETNLTLKRYLFNIAYDGTNYQGFQRQPNKKTIQGDIESVLYHLMKTAITIHPASRTDAQVHAHNQYFHADLDIPFSTDKLHTLMNSMLDADIIVKSITIVPYVFHARYDVIDKTYTYHLHHEKDPFRSKYSTYHETIRVNQLQKLMNPLIGTHDFKHFSKKHTKENSIRTIKHIAVKESETNTIIEITGTGFLRHMVRMIVGQALHDHDYNTNTLQDALENPKAQVQSFSVPACALHLDSISYKKSSH